MNIFKMLCSIVLVLCFRFESSFFCQPVSWQTKRNMLARPVSQPSVLLGLVNTTIKAVQEEEAAKAAAAAIIIIIIIIKLSLI